MASKSEAEERLLSTLQSHAIPLGTEDVSWAFSSKNSKEVVDYVERHLGDKTLFSLEEFDIYNHLSPSVQKSIWKDNDLLLIDPRTEADLIAETADLKAETEMLRKHTKLLKEQRRAMKQVFAEEKAARKRRREQVEQRRAKWTQERDEYRTRIDDMIKTLIGLVSHIHSQHGALSSLPGEKSAPIVDALLEFDDKTISRLGEIAETTEETADTGEDVFIQEVDELALKLTNLISTHLRLQLNRKFIETYTSHPPPADADLEQVQALETDLESLYADISSVARVVAEDRYVQPLMKDIRARKSSEEKATVERAEWMAKVLSILTERLEGFTGSLTYTLQSSVTLSTFISELTNLLLPRASQTHESTPKRCSSPTKTPHRNRRQNLPEHALLAHLNMPMPTALGARTPGLFTPGPLSNASLGEHLEMQISRLKSKIQLEQSSQKDTTPTATSITRLVSLLRILRDELDGEMDWPGGKNWEEGIVGEELLERMKVMDRGTGEMKAGMEEVGRMSARVEASKKREEFVARWARE